MLSKLIAFVKSYPVVGATWRLLRAAGAYGLGAAIAYLAGHFAGLPVPVVWIPTIGFCIQALDKFLREKGVINYP
jgi:hypothetical protein